jgi:hypothetical protein
MKLPQQQLLPHSCCREGSRDPDVPSGSRGSDVIHQHRPWRQVFTKKTLDEEKEDDAAEEEST